MGPGMSEPGSESWNIHAGCLSSHIACLLFLGEERVILSFGGKLFEALLGACSSTKIWILGALRLFAMQSEQLQVSTADQHGQHGLYEFNHP